MFSKTVRSIVNGEVILKNLTFDVEAGDILVILGPISFRRIFFLFTKRIEEVKKNG